MRLLLVISLFQVFILTLGFSQNEFSIAQIQGENSVSPLLNDQVTVNEAVVTAIDRDILYVQSMSEDGNPRSSEGILVDWDEATDFDINDIVRITGTVREFDNNTAIQAQTVIKLGENTTPIIPIEINDNFPGPNLQNINALEFAEGQLVSFTNMIITGPSIGADLSYISGASTLSLIHI